MCEETPPRFISKILNETNSDKPWDKWPGFFDKWIINFKKETSSSSWGTITNWQLLEKKSQFHLRACCWVGWPGSGGRTPRAFGEQRLDSKGLTEKNRDMKSEGGREGFWEEMGMLKRGSEYDLSTLYEIFKESVIFLKEKGIDSQTLRQVKTCTLQVQGWKVIQTL